MQRPLGVTIIAAVLAVSGVFNVVVGLDGAGILDLGLGTSGTEAQGWGYIIGGIVTILVSFGLYTLAGWSWTVATVVLVIRIALDVWAMIALGFGTAAGISAIIQAVISALILWYLFTPGVRSAFGR